MSEYRIAQNFDGENIDGLASFRSLTEQILTDSSETTCIVFAIQLENIERENFNGSLAKHQIRQYLPTSKFCTIQYNDMKLKIACYSIL